MTANQSTGLPMKLRALPNWVSWKSENINGNVTKPPYVVGSNRKASATNPSSWTSYDAAKGSVPLNGKQGIGFAFGDSGLSAIDIDGCRNPETNEEAPWLEEFMAVLPDGAYTEVSPSGFGVKVFVEGELAPGCDKVLHLDPASGFGGKVQIEFLGNGRYSTVTEDSLYDELGDVVTCDLSAVYKAADSLRSKYPAVSNLKKSNQVATLHNESAKIKSEGHVITSKLNLFMNGTILARKPFVIGDDVGNSVEYPSQSECDAAACLLLAEKCGCDAAKIDEEFRQSSLYREKWNRADYSGSTIKSAIEIVEKSKTSSSAAKGVPAATQPIAEIDWRKQFVTVDQLEEGGVRMLVEGFLPEGISMLGGLSGIGKTWFGLSLAKALTTATPFLGRFEVKAKVPVLYLIPESSGAAFRQRAEKFHITNDPNLFLCRTVSQGGTLLMDDPAVLAAVAALKPVVILDTAIRFNKSDDENSSTGNKALVDDSIALRAAGARGIFGMHHATKASAEQGITLQNGLRGTGDLGAMCDCVYALKRNEVLYDDGNGPLQISVICLKPRDFEPPLPFTIAATKKSDDGETISFIDTTGDFALIDVVEVLQDLNERFVKAVSEDPTVSLSELAELLGVKKRRVQYVADRLHYKKRRGKWAARTVIDTSSKPIEVDG